MAETAQTMTEFTYAPGEKNIVGDRFSPSVIIFWLKTSIAASSTRVQYRAPNTLFGLIPLGASTKTIPLRNIASVDTNTKFNQQRLCEPSERVADLGQQRRRLCQRAQRLL